MSQQQPLTFTINVTIPQNIIREYFEGKASFPSAIASNETSDLVLVAELLEFILASNSTNTNVPKSVKDQLNASLREGDGNDIVRRVLDCINY